MDKSTPMYVWIGVWAAIFISCHVWVIISLALTDTWTYGEPLTIAQFAWLVWLYQDGFKDRELFTR